MTSFNSYDKRLTKEELARGMHREMVGGLWEELGELQFRFMVEEGGLVPGMRLLDLGCGCLRGGIRFIAYLEPGHYYGLDINPSLIQAGWDIELPRAGLAQRLPREHLLVDAHFRAQRFGVSFDRVLAVSLWTHLPLNHIQRSLFEVSRVLKPGGRFYATFFPCPTPQRLFEPITHEPGGITTYRDQDPYHYLLEDIAFAARHLPLDIAYLGEWGHPRAQKMLCLTRR